MKLDNTTEPFFITEGIAAKMITSDYEYEPPPPPHRTKNLPELLEELTDAELVKWPDVLTDQEQARRNIKK